jgi:hypothetical protein
VPEATHARYEYCQPCVGTLRENPPPPAAASSARIGSPDYPMQPTILSHAQPTEIQGIGAKQWDVASLEQYLNGVLEGEAFKGSHRSGKFLRHIVHRTLAGDLESLKERAIGIEVFGRPPGYDTSADAIVRVTASDVRKRLLQHYSHPEIAGEYRISLPAGSYIPRIIREACPTSEQQSISPISIRIEGHGAEAGSIAHPSSVRRGELFRFVLAVMLISGLNLAAFLVAWNHLRVPKRLSVLPWSSILGSSRATQIVTSDPNIAEIQGFTGGQISLSDYANRHYIPDPALLTPEQLRFCQVILRGDKASAVDTPIAMAIGQLAQATSSKITVRGARDVQFSDMQTDANFIFLGSPRSNPWSNLYNDRLDLRFEYDPKTGKEVIRNVHPRPGEPPTYVETAPGWATGQSYAIVAFLQHLDQSGQVLFIAGQTAEGTEAAGKLVNDLPRLDTTLRKCGVRPTGPEHFEVLLRLNAMAGSPSNIDAVNCRAF